MGSIIGLFWLEDDATRSIQRLKEAGFAEDRIRILTQEKGILRLLSCDPTGVVARYAAWGAAFGVLIYATFALFAAWCECNLFGFGGTYGIGILIGGILAGTFVGGIMGCLAGAAESEKDSHLYIQGVRLGGRVIAVETVEEDLEAVKLILEQEKALGVKAL